MCGKKSSNLTVDHIIPQVIFREAVFRKDVFDQRITSSGIDGDITNLTLLCSKCNREKGCNMLNYDTMVRLSANPERFRTLYDVMKKYICGLPGFGIQETERREA